MSCSETFENFEKEFAFLLTDSFEKVSLCLRR